MKENEINEMQLKVLDAFFEFRSNLPFTDGQSLKEWKSTQDIVDDLQPMANIPFIAVIRYMQKRNYSMATQEDGNLKWAIWRKMQDMD